MNVEAPPMLRKGEQVGIRCSVYNFWDQDLEVCEVETFKKKTCF